MSQDKDITYPEAMQQIVIDVESLVTPGYD